MSEGMAVALSASPSSHQHFPSISYGAVVYSGGPPSSCSLAGDVSFVSGSFLAPRGMATAASASFGRYQDRDGSLERNTASTLSLEAIANLLKRPDDEEERLGGDISPPIRSYGFTAFREQSGPKKRKTQSFPKVTFTNLTPPSSTRPPSARRSRSVRFADTQGLPLERVRPLTSADPFQTEGEIVPSLSNDLGAITLDKPSPSTSPSPKRSNTHKTHARHFKFSQPGTQPNFYQRLQALKVSLESIKSENRALHGIVRTLNLSYDKHVSIRWTHDNWKSYHDTICTYCPGSSSDGHTDRFSFTIPVNGDDIHFAVLYRTPDGLEYWDNNDSKNYTVVASES